MAQTPKKQINFVKMLTEMTSIIFAVLLALWLENWMSERELQSQATVMLSHINAELTNNRQELTTAIVDNEKNIEGLKNFLNDDLVDINKLAPFLIISAGSTSNSAWESAKMTRTIGMMPIEVVTQLTKIYDTQEYYSSYVNFVFQQYTDLTTNIQFNLNAKHSTQKIVQHLAITNAFATQLLDSYETYLEKEKGAIEP